MIKPKSQIDLDSNHQEPIDPWCSNIINLTQSTYDWYKSQGVDMTDIQVLKGMSELPGN